MSLRVRPISYWGLRDYGVEGQIGLEPTPEEYVASIVGVFREVWRVLRDDATAWLNLGDSYSDVGRSDERRRKDASGVVRPSKDKQCERCGNEFSGGIHRRFCSSFCGGLDNSKRDSRPGKLKAKDLVGIPWRVAFALQQDGWYLRSDVIWCLSGGTWLYARTQKGEMPVMLKDLVRLDPATVQLWNGERWTQVLGWNQSADTSQRLELVLRSGERIGCTGNHQWPTDRGLLRASELKPGDVIQTCRLPDTRKPADDPAWLTDSALRFVGMYLAEGSRSGEKIAISGHAREGNSRFSWIERMAIYYGGSATLKIHGNQSTIRVYGLAINAILDTYIGGSTAIDKHLKVAAWRLSGHGLRSIAEGYLEGDGHDDQQNGRIRLGFCRNYAMERDLRTLAARLGATLTLNPSVAQSQWGERPAFRGEWRWFRSGHHNEKERAEVVEIRQSRARQFWDVGVADEPHLFALASGVLTHNSKPSPMPESVRDRPTKAHEYVFLLTKRPRYFYDGEAIKESASVASKSRYKYAFGGAKAYGMVDENENGLGRTRPRGDREFSENRNARSVWTISSKSYKGAHFATMPPKLVERCVRAGTSEKGCCPGCGTPWRRVVEKSRVATRPGKDSKVNRASAHDDSPYNDHSGMVVGNRDPLRHTTTTRTVGWAPRCECGLEPVPCRVLDPFAGSFTTSAVCELLGRDSAGVELNPDYIALGRERIALAAAARANPAPRSARRAKPRPVDPRQRGLFDGIPESEVFPGQDAEH